MSIYVFLGLAIFFSCKNNSQQDGDQGNNSEKEQTFASANEAASKAKSDLMEVVRNNKDLNLGVTSEELNNAEPGNPLRQAELDFNKLLRSENVTDFEQLIKGQKNLVVPLISNQNVVTIIELEQVRATFKIAGLAGKEITEDLNTLYKVAESTGSRPDFTIYDVPNLQIKVYGLKADTVNIYFTDYAGKFSIRQGVSARELLSVLREDAIRFEREFGDQIKKQKLLK